MKTTLLISVFIFSIGICNAQTIDKLSKKELRNALVRNIAMSDSLKRSLEKQNADIQELKNTISSFKIQKEDISKALDKKEAELKLKNEELRTKEQQNKSSQSKISSIEAENLKLKNELSKLQNDLIVVQEKIRLYSDSLSQSIVSPKISPNGGKDFLNDYFKNPFPLDNTSLRFSLRKVMLGNASHGNGNYEFSIFTNDNWGDNDGTNVNFFLPELISDDNLSFYNTRTISGSEDWRRSVNFYYKEITSDDFSNLLPRIDIVKNKLVTLNYLFGDSEDFLFNVGEGLNNNARRTMQLNLASESLNSETTYGNGGENDIIWKVFVIEGECYIALTSQHLFRLRVAIGEFEDWDNEFFNHSNSSNVPIDENSIFYVSRNQDDFMEKPSVNNSEDMIFLFKLIEVDN
jgi:hypothetical protein